MKVRGVVLSLVPRSPHYLGECLWRLRRGCKGNFQKLLGGFRSLTEILDLPSLSCVIVEILLRERNREEGPDRGRV